MNEPLFELAGRTITGAGGWSLVESRHILDMNGRRYWVWCALDAVGITIPITNPVRGQIYEFTEFHHAGLGLDTSLFGSSFYLLTGFHKLHVAVGMLMLLTLAVMSKMGRLPLDDDVRVDMVALYWHFVDIVWIIIFTFIYLIPVEV
jgi:heme/copper-type cytochrome/quinol oxidase subunit 3